MTDDEIVPRKAIEMKLGLEAGLIGLGEVVAWADGVLAVAEAYDDDVAKHVLGLVAVEALRKGAGAKGQSGASPWAVTGCDARF